MRDPSPAIGYYSGIVGAAACQKHPRHCDLSRGIVTSDADRTVTFHLEAADPEFLYKLALPFGAILPKGTPVGGTQRLPGTGPYKVQTFIPHRYVRLVRNPYFRVWSRAAQPEGLPDTIELRTNVDTRNGPPSTTTQAFRAAVAGRIDVPEGGVPPDVIAEARAQYPAQLHVTPAPQTNWVLLNTTRPPFNNVHARRALAYALDRARMVAIHGGTDFAAPTCQLLPPGLPGVQALLPLHRRLRDEPLAGTRSRARARGSRPLRNDGGACPDDHHRPDAGLRKEQPRGRRDPAQAWLPGLCQALRRWTATSSRQRSTTHATSTPS